MEQSELLDDEEHRPRRTRGGGMMARSTDSVLSSIMRRVGSCWQRVPYPLATLLFLAALLLTTHLLVDHFVHASARKEAAHTIDMLKRQLRAEDRWRTQQSKQERQQHHDELERMKLATGAEPCDAVPAHEATAVVPAPLPPLVDAAPGPLHFVRSEIPVVQWESSRLAVTSGVFDRFEDSRGYAAVLPSSRWTAIEQRAADTMKALAPGAAPRADAELEQKPLAYDPELFRRVQTPVMWIDGFAGDGAAVKWNTAAEARFVQLMRASQFPSPPVDCRTQKYLLIHQWISGFFSRYQVAVQSLARGIAGSDRMVVLVFESMHNSDAKIQQDSRDDFLGEGIPQYFAPWSQCSNHPYVLQRIRRARPGLDAASIPMASTTLVEIQEGGALYDAQFVQVEYSVDREPPTSLWMRRAMFDFGPSRAELETKFAIARGKMNQTELTALVAAEGVSITDLKSTSVGAAAGSVWKHLRGLDGTDHSHEHIYTQGWDPKNPTTPVEFQTKSPLTTAGSANAGPNPLDVRTQMFTNDFLEMMANAWFFTPAPRIVAMRNVISEFWAGQMIRRRGMYPEAEPRQEPLDMEALLGDGQVGAIMMRRGDKCRDDAYCLAHGGKFRPAGLFLHAIRLLEQKRGKPFRALFLMSDDSAELQRLLSYSRVATDPNEQPSTEFEIEAAYASGSEDAIVRAILKGRWLLYNHLAPPLCFNPSTRSGFEGFLVAMSFLVHHNCMVVGHESSNVSWFLAKTLYVQNQHRDGANRLGAGAWHQDVQDEYTH